MKQVTVQPRAKLNLTLHVAGKRPDGFHELRTVFQTIRLADRLRIRVEAARRSSLQLLGGGEIADNLVLRAADALLPRLRGAARITFDLQKRIPMGGGLGGGSSDAAAVLLTLPCLLGQRVAMEGLHEVAAGLGSDVPFFLHGGTMMGLGRGEELYPLPDARGAGLLLLTPGLHVSTPAAFAALQRPALTSGVPNEIMKKFGHFVTALPKGWAEWSQNDFEAVVFDEHSSLKSFARKLKRAGASLVRMSGSGSTLFATFSDGAAARAAAGKLENGISRVSGFLSRKRYRQSWQSQLAPYTEPGSWPPAGRN
jgi:4-diphosphocytidyl-2-C-methyl-D-erythritol kinase